VRQGTSIDTSILTYNFDNAIGSSELVAFCMVRARHAAGKSAQRSRRLRKALPFSRQSADSEIRQEVETSFYEPLLKTPCNCHHSGPKKVISSRER